MLFDPDPPSLFELWRGTPRFKGNDSYSHNTDLTPSMGRMMEAISS